jgi:hypothetical protein
MEEGGTGADGATEASGKGAKGTAESTDISLESADPTPTGTPPRPPSGPPLPPLDTAAAAVGGAALGARAHAAAAISVDSPGVGIDGNDYASEDGGGRDYDSIPEFISPSPTGSTGSGPTIIYEVRPLSHGPLAPWPLGP